MQIKGTNWYTASGVTFTPTKEGGTRAKTVYGYRLPLHDKSVNEMNELRDLLKSEGVTVKLKSSKNAHTGIPAGKPFFEVLDEKSVIALEKVFLQEGITLPPDRYKEYGLEHINRTSKTVSPALQFWSRLFGRK